MDDPRNTKKRPFMVQYLFCEKPAEFIEFIVKTFDAREVRERTEYDGMIQNAMVEMAGNLYEISQARGEFIQQTMSYHLYIDNHKDVLEKCKNSNCVMKYEEQKMEEYGDIESWVIDPFGNNWFIATPFE